MSDKVELSKSCSSKLPVDANVLRQIEVEKLILLQLPHPFQVQHTLDIKVETQDNKIQPIQVNSLD